MYLSNPPTYRIFESDEIINYQLKEDLTKFLNDENSIILNRLNFEIGQEVVIKSLGVSGYIQEIVLTLSDRDDRVRIIVDTINNGTLLIKKDDIRKGPEDIRSGRRVMFVCNTDFYNIPRKTLGKTQEVFESGNNVIYNVLLDNGDIIKNVKQFELFFL